MSPIILPRRSLIVPNRERQRGFLINPYSFGAPATGAVVTRLFNFNGTNGSTTFIEETGSGATTTVVGGAQLSTTSPKFGTACLLCGSGAWMRTENDAGLDFPVGTDFCIEGFVRWTTTGNGGIFHLFPGTPSSSHDGLALAYNGTNLQIDQTNITTTYAFTPTANTYYHWAAFRIGSTLYAAMDGSIKGSRSSSQGFVTNGLNLGMYFSSSFALDGRLDSCRVTKGSGVYSPSGFTPPSAQFTYP